MAWTDQCKIQAVETIKNKAEGEGLSERKAIRVVGKEAGIPASTLEKWYWPTGDGESESDSKNGVTQPPKKKEKTQKQHWGYVEKSMEGVVQYMMDHCLCVEGNLSRETAVNIMDSIRHWKAIEEHFFRGVASGKGE